MKKLFPFLLVGTAIMMFGQSGMCDLCWQCDGVYQDCVKRECSDFFLEEAEACAQNKCQSDYEYTQCKEKFCPPEPLTPPASTTPTTPS